MSKYKLIAFDMDGTLLNSDKNISQSSLAAIDKAIDAGKEVVLCTGRCVAELSEYFEYLPRIRYVICVSGALVYDVIKNETIYSNPLSEKNVQKILDVAGQEDTMIHILTRDSHVEKRCVKNMDHYHMGKYTPLFEANATQVEDIREFYKASPFQAEKVNAYHIDEEARNRTKDRLKSLDLVLVDAEKTSVECSASGVTKGRGLEELCKYLGIDIKETIAVGDADNDRAVLAVAGLSVAMGNALESLKKSCDVVVADCDHGGCAEAIEKYLLCE